jgi:hypothetical protein
VTREKRGEEGGGDATPNKYLKRRAFGLEYACLFVFLRALGVPFSLLVFSGNMRSVKYIIDLCSSV